LDEEEVMGSLTKGKILKVRIGHEANCSSGMIAGFLVIYGSGAYLLLSLITSMTHAVVRAANLRTGEEGGRVPIVYWIVPQVIGLVLTVLLGWVAFWDNAATLVVIALMMSIFLALSTVAGYVLIQRTRHPILLFGVVLLVPLIFAVCMTIYLRVFWGTWLWDIFASLFRMRVEANELLLFAI
jgi:hypothetical protein